MIGRRAGRGSGMSVLATRHDDDDDDDDTPLKIDLVPHLTCGEGVG